VKIEGEIKWRANYGKEKHNPLSGLFHAKPTGYGAGHPLLCGAVQWPAEKS